MIECLPNQKNCKMNTTSDMIQCLPYQKNCKMNTKYLKNTSNSRKL